MSSTSQCVMVSLASGVVRWVMLVFVFCCFVKIRIICHFRTPSVWKKTTGVCECVSPECTDRVNVCQVSSPWSCSRVINWSEICIMRSSQPLWWRASQTLVGCYSWVCSEGSPFKWNSCLWVIGIKVLQYVRAHESWFQCFLTHFISWCTERGSSSRNDATGEFSV